MEKIKKLVMRTSRTVRQLGKAGVLVSFVQNSAVIPVDLSVTRYRIFPADGMVEVWGYVGDYEVCVHLTIADAEARGLLREEQRKGAKKERS